VDEDELLAELETDRVTALYSNDTPPAAWWEEISASASEEVEQAFEGLTKGGCESGELLGLLRDLFWSTFLTPVRRKEVMRRRARTARVLADIQEEVDDPNLDFLHAALEPNAQQSSRSLQSRIGAMDRVLADSRRHPRVAESHAMAALTDYVDPPCEGQATP
jgi:hypothetical protein